MADVTFEKLDETTSKKTKKTKNLSSKSKKITKRQEAKAWKEKKLKEKLEQSKNGTFSFIPSYNPSVKLTNKSKTGFSFTRGKAETSKKQPSKNLNVIQRRKDKKIKDDAIAIKKQQEKENISEQINNTLKLFYKIFKPSEIKPKE